MSVPQDVTSLCAAILRGHVRSLSRGLRWLDDEDERGDALLDALYPHTGRAQIIGITGVPGAGKSTLTSALTTTWRRAGERVGILAIDPSSPFHGGALLGDRVRMARHAEDDDVFVRSLATRGQLGGLSHATWSSVHLLDAAGYDRVIVETVGVGQDEVDIALLADTTLVVLVPHLGDDVQHLKAGIMEIGDMFVVNKADLPGAQTFAAQLQAALRLRGGDAPVPVYRVDALRGVDIDLLADAIVTHAQSRSPHARQERRRARLASELCSRTERLARRAVAQTLATRESQDLVDRLSRGEVGPAAAAQSCWERLRASP